MNNLNQLPTTIYYDGLCHLCSREIDHYKKNPASHQIRFVDITHKDFNATQEGLDPFAVHKAMHVKTSTGEVKTGVDAFRAIWQVLPGYSLLYKITGVAALRPILDLGYKIFAEQIRPRLPKRKANCDQSPYCDQHQKV
jgi:predicted DCC family thiol-disulfide oxidoreductase YuxK